MAQSSTIGFALIVGFVVYITVRGELPAYLCVVGLGNGCPAPPVTPQQSATNTPAHPINTTSTITVSQNGGNSGNGTFPVYTTIDNPPVSAPVGLPPGVDWQLLPLPPPTGYGSNTTIQYGSTPQPGDSDYDPYAYVDGILT